MTAELLLNLIWLAIAVGAAIRLTMWCARQPRGTAVLPIIVATVCLVALLFPIISVTDDLSNDTTIIEETSAIRRAVVFVIVIVVAAVVVDLAPVLRSLLLQLALLTVAVTAVAVARPGFATVFSFRGPPAALAR